MSSKPLVGFRVLYVSALVAWILVAAMGIGYVVRDSVAAVERAFHGYTESVVAELRDKLKANEAVLAGFGSFLSSVGANDRPGVQRYADLMLAAYPHIYSLEVVREVGLQDRKDFENHLRRKWGGGFSIRSFSYDGARNWGVAPDKSVYQPIVFIWPERETARSVIGLDMDSVPHLREPLIEARARRVAISSKPFKLIQGDDAYVMFRHVDRSASQLSERPEYSFAGPLTALLVTRTTALLPSLPAPTTAHKLQITRHGVAIEPPLYDIPAAQPGSDLERWLFPTLRLQMNEYSTSQPMQLTVERQFRFNDLNMLGLTVITVFSLLLLSLLAAYLHGHNENVAKALALERRAEFLALHDPLTGLPNRHLLEDRVRQALAAWRRRGVGFALLFVDLDKFKDINDSYGHVAGDYVLCELSRRLADAVRESDTVARYGGDEFIVLISGVADDDDVVTVSGKILNSVALPYQFDHVTFYVTASLGISRCPENGEDFHTLLRRADTAMYGVKRDGRRAVGTIRPRSAPGNGVSPTNGVS